MRYFASFLPSRPTSLVALSAELLDHVGADADAVREGVTIIECPIAQAGDVADAIDALVFGDQAGRGWNADDGKVIIFDGHVDDVHFNRVLSSGRPVIVVSPANKIPSDAGVHQDRGYIIDGDLTDDIVKRVIEAVTGGDVPNAEARDYTTFSAWRWRWRWRVSQWPERDEKERFAGQSNRTENFPSMSG